MLLAGSPGVGAIAIAVGYEYGRGFLCGTADALSTYQVEVTLTLATELQMALISDRCFNKVQQDLSGPTISKRLKKEGYQVIEEVLLPDNLELIKKELMRLCDQREVNLILTTGGTGFSSRDVTPEATLAAMERNVPGISEAIRAESLKITKHAMLSRAVSVIRKKTLIINLPGSPKACQEAMDVFLDAIPHGLRLLKGEKVDK